MRQCTGTELACWIEQCTQRSKSLCAPQISRMCSLQARRRLVSASRMAAHAAGYHLGRMQSAAMRTFESPAAQGYCKA